MKIRPSRFLIALLFAGVIAVWATSWLLVSYLFPSWNERSAFGDMFGAVNALFSALAFAGLIVAVHLQTQELSLQRQELKETRDELRRTAEAQEKSEKALSESVALSREMVVEMRAARLQEIAPHVITYIDLPYGTHFTMFFVVKNIGKSVAKDITLKFEPKLKTDMTKTGTGAADFEIALIREGIKSLAPGQEIRTSFSSVSGYFRENLPSSYSVEVSYSGALQSERITTNQIIDLTMFRGLSVLQVKGEEDLVKAVEDIARAIKDVQRHTSNISYAALNGIWLKNPEFFPVATEVNQRIWRLNAVAKLNEFKLLWTSIYAGNYERMVSHYIENLQSRISILSSQVLLMASNAPPSIPSESVEALTNIAEKLCRLSEARFYQDGGESYQAFNSSGDEVLSLADKVIEMLTADIEKDEDTEKPDINAVDSPPQTCGAD